VGLCDGSGASVSAKLSVISLSPDPGQLVLSPMVVNPLILFISGAK
jgi:hypothetical protein